MYKLKQNNSNTMIGYQRSTIQIYKKKLILIDILYRQNESGLVCEIWDVEYMLSVFFFNLSSCNNDEIL